MVVSWVSVSCCGDRSATRRRRSGHHAVDRGAVRRRGRRTARLVPVPHLLGGDRSGSVCRDVRRRDRTPGPVRPGRGAAGAWLWGIGRNLLGQYVRSASVEQRAVRRRRSRSLLSATTIWTGSPIVSMRSAWARCSPTSSTRWGRTWPPRCVHGCWRRSRTRWSQRDAVAARARHECASLAVSLRCSTVWTTSRNRG